MVVLSAAICTKGGKGMLRSARNEEIFFMFCFILNSLGDSPIRGNDSHSHRGKNSLSLSTGLYSNKHGFRVYWLLFRN